MTTKNLLLCAIVFMAFSCTNEEDIFNTQVSDLEFKPFEHTL